MKGYEEFCLSIVVVTQIYGCVIIHTSWIHSYIPEKSVFMHDNLKILKRSIRPHPFGNIHLLNRHVNCKKNIHISTHRNLVKL